MSDYILDNIYDIYEHGSIETHKQVFSTRDDEENHKSSYKKKRCRFTLKKQIIQVCNSLLLSSEIQSSLLEIFDLTYSKILKGSKRRSDYAIALILVANWSSRHPSPVGIDDLKYRLTDLNLKRHKIKENVIYKTSDQIISILQDRYKDNKHAIINKVEYFNGDVTCSEYARKLMFTRYIKEVRKFIIEIKNEDHVKKEEQHVKYEEIDSKEEWTDELINELTNVLSDTFVKSHSKDMRIYTISMLISFCSQKEIKTKPLAVIARRFGVSRQTLMAYTM